jgi:hypothetical protein
MTALVALPLVFLGPVGWYVAFAFCSKAEHSER